MGLGPIACLRVDMFHTGAGVLALVNHQMPHGQMWVARFVRLQSPVG